MVDPEERNPAKSFRLCRYGSFLTLAMTRKKEAMSTHLSLRPIGCTRVCEEREPDRVLIAAGGGG
jgi:hypothetical protein